MSHCLLWIPVVRLGGMGKQTAFVLILVCLCVPGASDKGDGKINGMSLKLVMIGVGK